MGLPGAGKCSAGACEKKRRGQAAGQLADEVVNIGRRRHDGGGAASRK